MKNNLRFSLLLVCLGLAGFSSYLLPPQESQKRAISPAETHPDSVGGDLRVRPVASEKEQGGTGNASGSQHRAVQASASGGGVMLPGASVGTAPKPGPAVANAESPALRAAVAADALMEEAITNMDLSTEDKRAESAERMRQAQEAQRLAGEARARELGITAGKYEQIVGVGSAGMPAIRGLDNANAAISTNITAARARIEYSGLTGTGMIVGEWDGGTLRVTHGDYASRLVMKMAESETDANNFHSTHVAGILVGSGASNSSARGMAPDATLWYWDGASDLTEMTEVAAVLHSQLTAQTAIPLSNHSYGTFAGWQQNSTTKKFFWYGPATALEDPAFGKYNDECRAIDTLCAQATYYLPFYSAGNQRFYAPVTGSTVVINGVEATYDAQVHPQPDGGSLGYDSMGPDKMFKNALAVGSIEDAVVTGARNLSAATLTSFSSCGPADDGRVKPDLVANGSGLLSSAETADDAAVSRSGTSMASPNACGGAILLQQYAKEQLGGYLLNRELKALILHTADDIGNVGPDYQFGWGLMNTEAALDKLREKKNNPGVPVVMNSFLSSYTPVRTWQFVSTGGPCKITICWNDPAAALPNATLNSRTPMLVRDLDVRLISVAGVVQTLPWVLDPASPTAPATHGDNVVDNVEQIVTPSLTPGQYTVEVTRKGAATEIAPFSVVISGHSSSPVTTPILSATADTAAPIDLVQGSPGPTGKIQIYNAGIGVLNYTVSGSQSWVVPLVTSGTSSGETDTISVALETQNLAPGTYTANLTVTPVSLPGAVAKDLPITVRVAKNIWTLDEAMQKFNGPKFAWTTGGSAHGMIPGGFGNQDTFAYSGRMLANQNCWVRTTVAAPGLVHFDRRLMGAGSIMEILMDGSVVLTRTGTQEPDSEAVNIGGTGNRTVEIRYRRNSTTSDFADGLYVSNFTFFQTIGIPTIPAQTLESDELIVDFPYSGVVSSWSVSLNPTANVSKSASYAYTLSDQTYARLRIDAPPPGNYTVTVTATGPSGQVNASFALQSLAYTGFSGPDAPEANNAVFGPRWSTVTNVSHDGVDSAQSAAISHNGTTEFHVRFLGPALVKWWWKVSSEGTYDKLRAYYESNNNSLENPIATISGEQDWAQQSQAFPASNNYHYLYFEYSKDATVSAGQDRAWVDQVEIIPAPYIDTYNNQPFVETVGGQRTKRLEYYIRLTQGQVTNTTVDHLPPGMSLDGNLHIVGIPSVAGNTTSHVTLTGPGGSYTFTINWEIVAAGTSLQTGSGLEEDLHFTTSGSAFWYAIPGGIRSGIIDEGQSSELSFIVTGPGRLDYSLLLGNYSGDMALLRIDGGAEQEITEDAPPKLEFTDFASHQIRIRYLKNSDNRIAGQDRLILENLKYVPYPYYTGPTHLNAFQGQYLSFELPFSLEESRALNITDLPPGITSDSYVFQGTPTTTGSYVTRFDPYKKLIGQGISYVPGVLTFDVHPTVALSGSLEWTALLLYPISTGGNRPWFGQTQVYQDGQDAARAGWLADGESSWFQMSLPGDSVFKWRWKVSSERNFDKLRLTIDGEDVAAISGDEDWSTASLRLGPGAHTARFTYAKDGSGSFGEDTAWVDTVEYFLAPTLQSPTSLSATIGGNINSQVTGFWLQNGQYSASGLPPGVAVNSATGAITGAATSAGVFQSVISVTTEVGTARLSVTFTISPSSTGAAAADFSASSWAATRGQATWFGQHVITHDGIDAHQSGFIGHATIINDQLIPSLTTTSINVTGPGILTYWHKVDSEPNYDFLMTKVDEVTVLKRSGATNWAQDTVEIQPGSHRVSFVYQKDQSISNGLDAAWIDQVTFTPGPVPPPPAISAIRFGGSRSTNVLIDIPSRVGFAYTCEYSTNLTSWVTVPSSVPLTGNGQTLTFTHTGVAPSVFNVGGGQKRLYYRVIETRQ